MQHLYNTTHFYCYTRSDKVTRTNENSKMHFLQLSEKPTTLTELPSSVLGHIATFLSTRERSIAQCTCRCLRSELYYVLKAPQRHCDDHLQDDYPLTASLAHFAVDKRLTMLATNTQGHHVQVSII